MALISLRNIRLAFGGLPLLDGADLQLEAGERVCLVGRNGTGKTTLLGLVLGSLQPDVGDVERAAGLRIAALPQAVPTEVTGSVREVLTAGIGEGTHAPGDPVARIASRLELDLTAEFARLSGGQKRRALLGRALVGEPDLLLLDEPTNHLDLAAIAKLEELLLRERTTLLFVTHDRAFIERIATRIVELDRGRLKSWPGSYARYREDREDAAVVEARQQAVFDKKLAEEEAWIRRGIKARRTRNEGRVRALLALRAQRRDRREEPGSSRLAIHEAERSGKVVLRARGLGFSYGDQEIITDLSLTVSRGDRLGVIGPNGSGKTTLLHLLLGRLAPQQGTIEVGANLEVVYLDQLRAELDDTASLIDNLADGHDQVIVGGEPRHVLGYLGDFLFTADRARSPVGILSGGERNRLLLAKLFTRPANVLVLDEPTNDLDIETLELLEEKLGEFGGTVLLVSHDRTFLNNVVSSTLAYEGPGRFAEYAGGYDDWLLQRPAEAAPRPTRPRDSGEQSSRAPRPPTSHKLTFKEKRELEELPARIEALEAEQSALETSLGDPGFYSRPGAEIAAAVARVEALEAERGAAYDRWSELEDLRKRS